MSRYEYDFFISFHNEAKNSVTKFLSKYQTEGNWKVFLGNCNLSASNEQLYQAIFKSRIVFTVISNGCDDSDACETHKMANCTLGKVHYEICWHHFKKSAAKQETFEHLQKMLAKFSKNEKLRFTNEKTERRERMGLLDLDMQDKYQNKYLSYRRKMVQAKVAMAFAGNLTSQWKLENGTYHGLFNREGQRDGVGAIDYFNGDMYSGEWKNDKKHGFGLYAYKSDVSYEGEWVNNKKDGLCVIRKDDFVTYRGSMKNGEKSGKGIADYQCGSVYGGDWLNGNKCGSGVFWNDPNEELYDGQWLNNKKHGKGVYIYRNDMKYDGEWVDDLKEGRGTLWFSNGDRFEGVWLKGKKHGDGVLYAANGDVFDCNYDNDKEVKKEKRIQKGDVKEESPIKKDEAIVVKSFGELTWKVDKSKPKPFSIISGEHVIAEATLAELDDLIAQLQSAKAC